MKAVVLPSPMCPLRFFFSSNGVLVLLCWSPGLPKRFFHPCMIVKIGILWWKGSFKKNPKSQKTNQKQKYKDQKTDHFDDVTLGDPISLLN